MIRPGKRDHTHIILITGLELQELKKDTWMMAESFGLYWFTMHTFLPSSGKKEYLTDAVHLQ